MLKPLFIALGLGASAWIAANTLSETASQSVAGHHFAVPKKLLFDETIAWLPRPESDSFVFLFEPNPNPSLIPEHRVLVEPMAGRCPGGASQILRVACGEEKAFPLDKATFEKRQSELGSWASDLFAVRQDAESGQSVRQQVAYCQLFAPNPANPRSANLCTTFWSYKGLRLQFEFDEKDVAQMPAMRARAMAMLDKWQIP